MKYKLLLLSIVVIIGITACTSKDAVSSTPFASTNTETPSPTPYMDEKINRAVRIAAEAVKQSEFYSEDGKVGQFTIDLSKAKSVELCTRSDKICYRIIFGTPGEELTISLLGVVITTDTYEVVEIGQMK